MGWGFLGKIAQGNSGPGGGVFGFLNQAAQGVVNPVSKVANEGVAAAQLIKGNEQGAQKTLSPGGGLGHQGGVLGGAELNNGAVFIGPNATQNIKKTVGTGASIASNVAGPEFGFLAKGSIAARAAKGAAVGAPAGAIGTAGSELANGEAINPRQVLIGAAAGAGLGAAAPAVGEVVHQFKTGNELGAVGKDVAPAPDNKPNLVDVPLAQGGTLRIDNTVLQDLVKAQTPNDVKNVLMKDNLPADVAAKAAPAIASTKDPNVIANIIDQSSKPIPSPAPAVEAPPTPVETPPASAGQGTDSVPTSPESQTIIDALTGKAADGGAMALRREQEASYSAEKTQRLDAAAGAAENLTGSDAYRAKLSQLKGDYTKVEYRGLADQLSGTDAENLYSKFHDQIEQNGGLSDFGKLNTQTALRKVIFGEGGVPTSSEIKLLQNQFGEQLANTVKQDVANHSARTKLLSTAGQVLGVPRAIMASADLSGSLRQGLAISARHPIEAAKAFGTQFKVAFSPENYKQLQDEITSHPNYPLAQQAKLAIQSSENVGVSEREEQFASNLADKLPGIGKVVQASNRAYTGFLDSIRFNVFNNLVQRAEDAGINFSTAEGDKVLRNLGEVINTSSGRGSLGPLEQQAQGLSIALFAPRLIASRLQMINPHYYIKLDPIARREALTTTLALGAFVGSVLEMAKLGGAQVGTNPTSADFGKIKVGDTRFDIAGGYQQYLRLGAQLTEGKITSSTTGNEVTLGAGFGKPTRLDIVNNFLQNKENPVLSFATTLLKGKDASGNSIYNAKGIEGQITQRFVPLIAQDIADLVTHPNSAGLAAAIPGAVGVGLQTYGTQDLPLTAKQQGELDTLKQNNAPPEQIAAEKSFFQFLKQSAGVQQNTSDKIDQALAKGDSQTAQSLADQYNQKLINGMKPWAKNNAQYLDDNLAKELQGKLINLDDQSINSRLQGILNNPQKYHLKAGG